ncbi:hypothetical protein NQ314_005117 [Rhamnusium bicolor]|uniref:Uncharacterized protein n=1 Tax=Rhamnusium bicolor TaxID=1586634 RepID=A0AAV8ZJ65_9CUCU|nr:hypothetical protein NQ314_005117 [Rhamnusium bicolor]
MFNFSASAISSTYDRWNTGPHVILIPDRGSGDNTLSSLPAVVSGASDGVPSDNTEDEEWSRGSGEDPDLDIVDTHQRPSSVGGGGDTSTPTTELDRKVQLAARLMQRNCNCASGKCDKLKVRKVGEGKYNIAGKNFSLGIAKSDNNIAHPTDFDSNDSIMIQTMNKTINTVLVAAVATKSRKTKGKRQLGKGRSNPKAWKKILKSKKGTQD